MSGFEIFISYSHNDQALRDRLLTHLRVLQPDPLQVWLDARPMLPGQTWYSEIQEALATARVAILLLSADFLTSNFIQDEAIHRLFERRQQEGLHIVPVIVNACSWRQLDWLSHTHVLPTSGRPLSAGTRHQIETTFATIAGEVARISTRVAQEEQHAELLAIASKVDLANDDLQRLYKASLPSPRQARPEVATLRAVLEHLWDIPPRRNHRLPICDFLGQLALATSNQGIAAELRTCTDRIAALGLHQEYSRSVHAEFGAPPVSMPESDSYTLVELSPDPQNHSYKIMHVDTDVQKPARPSYPTPRPGTAGWGRMNRRRAELIRKKNRQGLTAQERGEFEQLQSVSHTALEEAFPRPKVDIDSFIRLRQNLQDEAESSET